MIIARQTTASVLVTRPKEWDPQDSSTNLKKVSLPVDSREYQKIKQMMQTTMTRVSKLIFRRNINISVLN